jgi:hypothetical protein
MKILIQIGPMKIFELNLFEVTGIVVPEDAMIIVDEEPGGDDHLDRRLRGDEE